MVHGPLQRFVWASQHQLPVRDIDPPVMLEPDLTKRTNWFEPELLVQGNASVIWKGGTTDGHMHALCTQYWKKGSI